MKEKKVVLSIQDLHVRFSLRGQVLHAIRGVSLDVCQGESLAIVGESGSGKSVFVKCAMGLLDANGFIESGSIIYDGMDLTKFTTDKDWQKIRGREIAMVFQDPMTSLNPLKTIGKQIQEAVELHRGLRGKEAYEAVLEVLTDVGIDDPARRYKQYPHEFSGGCASGWSLPSPWPAVPASSSATSPPQPWTLPPRLRFWSWCGPCR